MSLFLIKHNVFKIRPCHFYTLLILAYLYAFNSSHLYAQQKKILYSDQYWMQYYGQLELNRKWAISFDGGLRMKIGFKEKAASLGRAGLQYKINNVFSIAVGGAYFSQYSNDKISREEWRSYEELFMKHGKGRFSFTQRIRLEERFFHTLATRQDNFNYRFRYKFQWNLPLNHTSMENKTIYLILADEVFLNFGKEINYNYDQNRTTLGIGYKLNNSISASLNYVYQYAQKNSAALFEHSDIIWLQAYHTLSTKSKKREEKK